MYNLFKIALIGLCVLKVIRCSDSPSNENERSPIKKRLLELQQIKTGYPVEEEYDVSGVAEDGLKRIELYKIGQIKCGYLFHSQLHMEMTKDFLLAVHRKDVNVKIISYEAEASIMVNTLFRFKDLQLNELLLIFMYAHKIQSYFNELPTTDANIDKKMEKSNLDMHNFVEAYVKQYTKNHCLLENVYNMKWDKCEVINKYRKAKRSKNGRAQIMDIIQNNKMALYNDIVEKNIYYGVEYSDANKIDYRFLYFYDLVTRDKAMNNFVYVFGGMAQWADTLESLKNALADAKNTGLKGIINIGKYQHMFVDFLKAIIMRITCKHLFYMQQLEEETAEEKIKLMNIYKSNLKEFVDFVCLNEDYFFKNVLAYYESESLEEEARNTVIDNINNELASILTKLGCNTESPIILDDVNSPGSFNRVKVFTEIVVKIPSFLGKTRNKPIDDAIFSVQAYIAYLRYIFSDGQFFEVAHSVMELTDDIRDELKENSQFKKYRNYIEHTTNQK